MLKKVILLCCCAIIINCNNKDGLYVNSPINYAPIAVCENGFAGEYPCNDYDLLSHFNLDELAGSVSVTASSMPSKVSKHRLSTKRFP